MPETVEKTQPILQQHLEAFRKAKKLIRLERADGREALETTSDRIKKEEIAQALGISAARFSQLLKGSTLSREMAQKLAELFHPRDPLLQRKFKESFGYTDPDAANSDQYEYLEALADGKANLRISTLEYPPFSTHSKEAAVGSTAGFFNQVFYRFLRQSGIGDPILDKSEKKTRFDIASRVWNREVDIALCYFAAVDRSLKMRFHRSPIRISIICIIDSRFKEFEAAVRRKIAYGSLRTGIKDLVEVRPITLRDEVGDVHCRNTLRIPPDARAEVKNLDPLEFRTKLRELSDEEYEKWGARDRSGSGKPTIPCIVVDEFTALGCMNIQETELVSPCTLVFPITTRQTNRSEAEPERRELPLYFVSFAYSRRNEAMRSFLQDSWPLFLRCEVETTSQAYASLAISLVEKLKPAFFFTEDYRKRWEGLVPEIAKRGHLLTDEDENSVRDYLLSQLASEWVMFALQLDEEGAAQPLVFEDAWRPILRRAREIFRSRVASQTELLEQHIRVASRFDRQGYVAQDGIAELERLYDVKLSRSEREDGGSQTQNPMEVRRNLIQSLTPGSVSGRFTLGVETVETLEDLDGLRAFRNLLGQLQQFYLRSTFEFSKAAAQGIGHFVSTELEELLHGRKLRGYLVYVSFEGSSFAKQYIGCCTLQGRVATTSVAAPALELAEMRYLWVGEQFRKIGAGRELLKKLKADVLSENLPAGLPKRPDLIVAEVLPELRATMQILVASGFAGSSIPIPPRKEGRCVFTWAPTQRAGKR